jgi:hypothetical protein
VDGGGAGAAPDLSVEIAIEEAIEIAEDSHHRDSGVSRAKKLFLCLLCYLCGENLSASSIASGTFSVTDRAQLINDQPTI